MGGPLLSKDELLLTEQRKTEARTTYVVPFSVSPLQFTRTLADILTTLQWVQEVPVRTEYILDHDHPPSR